jgi:L-alanine-DL-glutamate epimerase-like enolase superfamily enzyme
MGGPYPLFGGIPRTAMEILALRVDTDAGISGWGEAFGGPIAPATRQVIEQQIAPLVIGRDATSIEALMSELARKLQNFGRGGPITFALSGLDIALWDIAGKAAGLPLHRLLGGAVRREITAYASLLAYHDPALIERNAAEAVANGFHHVKLHEKTVADVAAGRKGVGEGVRMMVDTNCPWNVGEAIAMARALAPHEPTWIEEPVWPPEDFAGLAQVRRSTPIMIAAGENARTLLDFKLMLEAGAVSVIQPSISKMGGITEMRKVMALAEAFNVRLVPHCIAFGPAALATMHILSTATATPLLERYYCTLEASPFGEALLPKNGRVRVPDGPGLGAEPDPELLARYSVPR